MDNISRDSRREFMTIAIGMVTVDGKEVYQEEHKVKALFDLYNVFDEVFSAYDFYL